MTVSYTNNYLIVSSKKKCKKFLKKKNKNTNDISDFLINLHLVLEISLNQLFREIVYYQDKFNNLYPIYEEFDNISFLDKTVALICFSSFSFSQKTEDIEKKSITLIKRIKDFAGVRNKLLHGHHIGFIKDKYLGKKVLQESKTKQLLTEKYVEKQIKNYIEIVELLNFYISNLSEINTSPTLIYNYLNSDFLKSEEDTLEEN